MADGKLIQSRKWLITINNPIDKGFSHEELKNALQKLEHVVYWCMSDETGENGTFHTHIYLVTDGAPIRRGRLDNLFTGGHFDKAIGLSSQNRDYVFKEGKWLDSEKGTTNHRDSHEEWGEMPVEKQGKRNDLTMLYEYIKDGLTDYEILEQNPDYITRLDKVERVRQSIKDAEYKDVWRDLSVTYVYGVTGSGKTRDVMEKYGYSNVYRVTDYVHPFDTYRGQDVIIFEEFRSDLPLSDMLKYLDGYPVELPARYFNRVACFTKVFIISNIDLRCQYPNKQKEEVESWYAFLRRIHFVKIYGGDYEYEQPTELYLSDFYPFIEPNPFDKGVAAYG